MSADITATESTRLDQSGGVSLLIPVTVAFGVFMTSLDQNVIVTALRAYGETLPKRGAMNASQRALYDELIALSRETAKRKKPAATSDRADMYDESGLPA